MKTYCKATIVLLVASCIATKATAGDYDYEVRLSFDSGQSDSTTISLLNGVPTPSLGVATSSSDSDNIDLSGAWYYSGLSDASGPKSRAAFLSRASSIVVGYSHGDDSGSFNFSSGGILPPISGTTDTATNAVSARLRHVWRDAGWFVLAEVARANIEAESNFNGVTGSTDIDATIYSVGVGKYLGKSTAVEFSVAEADTDGFDATRLALSFRHVGTIGANWQYSTDLAIATSDGGGDERSYSLYGSLYPSPNIEFGLGLSRRDLDAGFDVDMIEGFVRWFVRDHVELTARYRTDNPDTAPGQDVDSDAVGIGVGVRF